MTRPPDLERRLLIRARAVITAQVAAAVTVVVALVGTLVYCMTIKGQDTSARRDLAVAVARADIAHPPPCIWLFELRGATLTTSPGAPADLPVRTALRRVAADHRTRVDRVTVGGRAYVVRTAFRDGMVRQAVIDLRYQAEERRRLYGALAAAEAAGLVAALLVGQLLSRRAIAPLGEALARQRRFVADASHELRTPLTQLHTRAQLLERRLRQDTDPSALADEVRRMVTGTRQLGEVIDDLLLSAQLRQARGLFGTVDLGALADGLIAAESARAEARELILQVRRRDAGPHIVRGVEPALRRVVTSLIDNAFGHTTPGGHITVTLARVGATVELEVHDDGVGLDPRDAERLFTRFARGEHGAGRRFGLGLALVREVVDGHGGTIEVDGRPGAGAAFTVRLPAEPSVRTDPAARPTGVEPAEPSTRTEPAEPADPVSPSPPRPAAARRSPSR
ncbi:HAMP domain-containing histidine kinase [Actinoallomurus purpureus]|uniref:sensor histidine kinase n=1 Tax=Actinoallomurus purpureus TaxID=478114 RepID=UPI0020920CE3|nr:HAMP domain-containing sensor histidine kinase [Actinoallomurus purpureus]MCO6005192.1 HAMP domain-containing histidine kinase [Actinoallomurus purpureus]